MAEYAVVVRASGELVSTGTVLADPLPAQYEAIVLARKPDWSTDLWDLGTRALVARPTAPPLRDRVDDIMAEPEFLLLNTLNRDGTRAALIRNLSDPAVRYY